MTDIYAGPAALTQVPVSSDSKRQLSAPYDHERLVEYVELLFFAYRDFTGEADAVLAEFGFGRAHHRVLHFVNRRPGLRVADLLDILKITKQSLARVLKQLVDEGYVLQQAGEADRRERLLYLTAKGSALADKLVALQIRRVAEALAEAGAGAGPVARQFLASMIAEPERPRIERLISGAGEGAADREEQA
jgi:DNA-binding MarR family transcriptional regulator